MEITDNDIDTLARTMYGEARGEGLKGMTAVACVVINRAAAASVHPHFGDGSLAGACQAKWQFSCWNENDPNLPKLKAVTEADPYFRIALDVARAVQRTSQFPDVTNGATYYYVANSPRPAWADGKTPCATIGKHLFFKNIA